MPFLAGSSLLPLLGGIGGGLALGGAFGGDGGSAASVQQLSNLSPAQTGLQQQIIESVKGGIGQPRTRLTPSSLGPIGPSALQQQAFGLGSQLPGQLGFDPAQIAQQFAPTAAFARQGFQQEIIPAIMAALGAQGAARSSGAANILGRQGRN
ncbi:hypothetical protein LCGC14_1080780, partial [marine sediment metagenome]